MYFLTKMDDFFSKLFSGLRDNISWATLGVLLAGVMIGFVLCLVGYGIAVAVAIRNDKRFKNQNQSQNLTLNDDASTDLNEIDQEVLDLVKDIKKNFLEQTEGFTSNEKIKVLSSTIWETINVIAGVYYPESKYPLYELNVLEILKLVHYLSNRIESMFDKTLLRPFKKMSISQVFRFLDAKKRIEKNKLVKAADKMKVGKISKAVGMVLNYANPVYWFKKLVIGGTVNFALNKISLVIIDIVADETNKTYSKRIFNEEKTLMYQEIEDALKEMEE